MAINNSKTPKWNFNGMMMNKKEINGIILNNNINVIFIKINIIIITIIINKRIKGKRGTFSPRALCSRRNPPCFRSPLISNAVRDHHRCSPFVFLAGFIPQVAAALSWVVASPICPWLVIFSARGWDFSTAYNRPFWAFAWVPPRRLAP